MKRLKTNITNIYGDQGKVWLDDLPRIVDELAKEYGLSRVCHQLSQITMKPALSKKLCKFRNRLYIKV